jgi:hypothetical protein
MVNRRSTFRLKTAQFAVIERRARERRGRFEIIEESALGYPSQKSSRSVMGGITLCQNEAGSAAEDQRED